MEENKEIEFQETETEKTDIDSTELKRKIRKASSINGIMLILFWIVYFVIELPGESIAKLLCPKESSSFDGVLMLVVYTMLYPVGIPLIVALANKLIRKEEPRKLKESFRKSQMPASWTAKYIIISIFLAYAASFITVLFTIIMSSIFGVTLNSAGFTSEFSVISTIATALATTIYAPVFEEIFFRATLYKNVEKYGTWSMIIVAGLTFGIWHANFAQIFFAGIIGICSCFIYTKTQSIRPCILLHFIINTIGCTATIILNCTGLSASDLDTSKLLENIPAFLALLMVEFTVFVLCIIGLIFFIIELTNAKKNLTLEKRGTSISGIRKVGIYLTSVPMIVIMIFMFGFTILRTAGVI